MHELKIIPFTIIHKTGENVKQIYDITAIQAYFPGFLGKKTMHIQQTGDVYAYAVKLILLFSVG